jgi:hypothetical protein
MATGGQMRRRCIHLAGLVTGEDDHPDSRSRILVHAADRDHPLVDAISEHATQFPAPAFT